MKYLLSWSPVALFSGLSLLFTVLAIADPGAARLFWTDKDAQTLEVSDLDGGNRTTLLTGLADPRGIAVDTENNTIYWASHVANGSIFTAKCDGTDVQTFLDFLPEPTDLALDLANGVIYWAEQSANRICRASLSDPLPEIVIDGLNQPYYIAIDPEGGFLYWSDFNSTIIHWSTIDGAGPSTLVSGQSRVRDIELAGGKIYWCDRNSSQIRSRDINGVGSGTILFSGTGDSLDRPHGLVLDAESGTMFWTDTTTDEINGGAMDGSGGVTTLVSSGLVGAWGIALSKPVTTTTPYQSWLSDHFSAAEIANSALEETRWGELADPDLDGLLNLYEFATGSSPLDPVQDHAALRQSLVEDSGQTYFEIVFRIRMDDPTLNFVVESSRDLGQSDWQSDRFTEVPPRTDDPAHPGYQFVTVRSEALEESVREFFARLRVSR